ncbi:MAG: hypothetical protein MUF30_12630 [Burkholderiales bacterium]|jgi:hypothetical protein|nr:hypothetical protein [Burkholderiales bacterium]
MSLASAAAPVPPAYHGVWRRTLLRVPGQPDDTTSEVWWLQTQRWHADLRVRADRPMIPGDASLATLDRAALTALAEHKGFAGVTTVDGDVCRWHRRVDFQPPSGWPDVGRMQFETPERALEFGVEQDYFEIWERLPGSAGPVQALEAIDATRPTWLLRAGTYVMRVRPRRDTLATHRDGLTALAADVDDATLRTWLDFELSFAGFDAQGRCTIQRSTLPWLEGRAIDEADALTVTDAGASALAARHWRVLD